MDTSKKFTGVITGPCLFPNWVRRVSVIPNLLALTSVSMNMLGVTTHSARKEIWVLHSMPDTVAVIGKLFYYPVSPYAFQRKISQFQVNL